MNSSVNLDLGAYGISSFVPGEASFFECERPIISRVIALNRSNRPILIQEGFLIEGLKQSRMVTQDQVLGPGESAQISVACVESGRWGLEGIGSHFGRAPLSVIAAARRGALGPTKGRERRAQEMVWSSVSLHHTTLKNSRTTSLTEVVSSYKKERRPLQSDYKSSKGQTGVVVSALGKPLAMEVFESQEIFELQFKEIVQSFLWDVPSNTRSQTSKKEIVDFLREIADISSTKTSGGTSISFNSTSLNSSFRGSVLRDIHGLAINQQHPILV